MKVLVTGAAGGLGRATCAALREAGHEVRGTDQRYDRAVADEFRVADLRQALSVYPLLEGVDAVVHLANHPSIHSAAPHVIYAENTTMNVHVFQAAIDVGVRRIVFASSIQAMSGNREAGEDRPSILKYLPIDGDAPAAASNLYGLSKVASEELLRFCVERTPDLVATALRFPYLVPLHRRWRMNRLRREVRPGIRLDEAFAYLFATDAGRLIADILARQEPGYHQYLPAAMTPSTAVPIPDLVRDYYQGVELRQPVEAMAGLVDTSRITREIGWTPREQIEVEDDQPAATA